MAPTSRVTTDRLLLITDITLDDAGAVVPATATDRANGRQGQLLLVNGQHQPTITAAPGSTERWRIVNACTSRFLALRLEGHQLDQIALDGSFLPRPAGRDSLVLAQTSSSAPRTPAGSRSSPIPTTGAP